MQDLAFIDNQTTQNKMYTAQNMHGIIKVACPHLFHLFDTVTLWDVFEHLMDGEFYLNEIQKILSDDGVIFLQAPSTDALAAKILREHVNLYGVKTIEMLANKCSLEVLSLKTAISEIGVINNYLNYENPYLGSTTNKELIPNLIDDTKIHEILQGYKLQVILGKKK